LNHFMHPAPWSRSLIGISVSVSLLMAGISTWILVLERGPWGVGLLPVVMVVTSALFQVRGYTVGPGGLQIHRLLWITRVGLEGLKEVLRDPEAMRGSLRLLGNGGLFSFTGLFRNRTLGMYRAFVTDPRRAVVLRLPRRTVVVSPADPEAFVREVQEVVR
jgi:Bacterial PH domain